MTEMSEQARQRTSRVTVVLYEQNSQRLCRMFGNTRTQISCSDSFWHRVECDSKRGAETPATALRFNCAMVKVHEMFRDRET